MSTAGAPAGAPLAVIAGGGVYPPLVTRIARAAGRPVFVAALEGVADPVAFEADVLRLYRLGQLGKLLEALRARSIVDIVLIGALPRPSFGALRPEASTLKYLPHFARAFQGGDDHLLKGVVSFFEGQGFTVLGPADIAPELVARAGPIGQVAAGEGVREAIARGFDLIAALSPFDVGQAAVLADHRIVAIEAAEGTDAMLKRVADMVGSGRLRIARGDGFLVKAPKRGQDLRVDMPAIGPDTLRHVAAAGLSGLAIRAGGVLVGDTAELARLADRAGLFVEGVA